MEYWEQAKNNLDRCYLKRHRQHKLHRIAFHRAVGKGGSADKEMKCPNPTGYVGCLVLNRRRDVYLNFPK